MKKKISNFIFFFFCFCISTTKIVRQLFLNTQRKKRKRTKVKLLCVFVHKTKNKYKHLSNKVVFFFSLSFYLSSVVAITNTFMLQFTTLNVSKEMRRRIKNKKTQNIIQILQAVLHWPVMLMRRLILHFLHHHLLSSFIV